MKVSPRFSNLHDLHVHGRLALRAKGVLSLYAMDGKKERRSRRPVDMSFRAIAYSFAADHRNPIVSPPDHVLSHRKSSVCAQY